MKKDNPIKYERKTLYLPGDVVGALQEEADKNDRSLSYFVSDILENWAIGEGKL